MYACMHVQAYVYMHMQVCNNVVCMCCNLCVCIVCICRCVIMYHVCIICIVCMHVAPPVAIAIADKLMRQEVTRTFHPQPETYINNNVYFVTEEIEAINNECVSSLYAPRFVSGRQPRCFRKQGSVVETFEGEIQQVIRF